MLLTRALFVSVLGVRRGSPREFIPSSVPLAMTGMALLWFGWFGFNAGSALARYLSSRNVSRVVTDLSIAINSGSVAVVALVNSQLAVGII